MATCGKDTSQPESCHAKRRRAGNYALECLGQMGTTIGPVDIRADQSREPGGQGIRCISDSCLKHILLCLPWRRMAQVEPSYSVKALHISEMNMSSFLEGVFQKVIGVGEKSGGIYYTIIYDKNTG